MDRTKTRRTSGPKFGTKLALLASAAVMTAGLTANATYAAPRAEVSYSKAQKALSKGKATKAISYAEAAVLAEPRNAEYRSLLGKAYLEAGRYTAAAMSFGDALKLGDRNPRTVLSYALTQTAIGGSKNALNTLSKHERMMDPADLGLAMALAGNPDRGVNVLTNAVRSGQNTPKIRQNLAYTYALAGNWRAARVMAAEDVPADQLDARLSQWAATAKPEDHMVRVSQLLGIAPVRDGGLPASLALSNFEPAKPMVAKAKAPAPVKAKAPAKKAPVRVAAAPKAPVKAKRTAPSTSFVSKPVTQSVSKPASAPKPVAQAMAAVKPVSATPKASQETGTKRYPVRVAKKPAPVAKKRVAAATPRRSSKSVSPSFVSRPVTQRLPVAAAPKQVAMAPKKKAPAPKPVAKPAPKGDSHLVQLGSYNSEAEAKAGWNSLKRKFSSLASHDVVITKAEVKGRTFYRIAAAGFGRQGAAQMCSTVRTSGRGCFAYAKINPPKGAVGNGTRIAAKR